MTETLTDKPNLWEWYRQLNQHDADALDIDLLRHYLETMGRLGSMIRKDRRDSAQGMEIFTVHGSHQHRSLTRPLLGYVGEGYELRILELKSHQWLVSVKVTNDKPPAFPKLNRLIEEALPDKLLVALDFKLPEEWSFGEFAQNSREFTVWLSHDHWLFAFVYLLLDELSQY